MEMDIGSELLWYQMVCVELIDRKERRKERKRWSKTTCTGTTNLEQWYGTNSVSLCIQVRKLKIRTFQYLMVPCDWTKNRVSQFMNTLQGRD